MARQDPQVNLRIPEALKTRLEVAAKDSNRSVTAEIVSRLEDSFNALDHSAVLMILTKYRAEAAELEVDKKMLLMRIHELGGLLFIAAKALKDSVNTDDQSLFNDLLSDADEALDEGSRGFLEFDEKLDELKTQSRLLHETAMKNAPHKFSSDGKILIDHSKTNPKQKPKS